MNKSIFTSVFGLSLLVGCTDYVQQMEDDHEVWVKQNAYADGIPDSDDPTPLPTQLSSASDNSGEFVGPSGVDNGDPSSPSTKLSSSSMKTTSSSTKLSSSSMKVSSSSVNKSSSSYATSTVNCGDLWCGPDRFYRVNTGIDVAGEDNSGYWFSYGDDSDGGASIITWPVTRGNEYSEDAFDPVIDHCGGLCGTFALNKGTLTYDPFAGVGFSVGGYDASGAFTIADASSWGGVCVVYTTDGAMTMEMGLGDKGDASVGYDVPFVSLPKASAPVTKDFPWSSFKQAGWGKGKVTGDEASTKVAALKFKYQAKDGSVANFNIISVGRYGTCSKSTNTQIQSSSSAYTVKCGDMWCGGDNMYRVDTEIDAAGEGAGYWFDYNDLSDGGASKITWPVPRGNEYDNNAFDPVIDYCKGICGTFTLDKGSMTYDPFVGVGFSVGGYDNLGKPIPIDASSWGGICIVYTSDVTASLELGLGDNLDESIGYDNPFASLSKTASPVLKDIPWSSFKQAGWGKRALSTSQIVESVATVKFKIQAKTGSTGEFKILAVGRYQSCFL